MVMGQDAGIILEVEGIFQCYKNLESHYTHVPTLVSIWNSVLIQEVTW